MKLPLQMLSDCLEIIRSDKKNQDINQVTTIDLYEQLLDWVAVKLAIEPQVVTPPFQVDTHDLLHQAFRPELLIDEPWDWFGELAAILRCDLAGINITMKAADTFVNLFVKHHGTLMEHAAPQIVFDPSVGTGRTLLRYHIAYGKRLLYYGVEPDKLSYRTALLNVFLYNIPAFILWADPKKHIIEPNSRNWLASGQWYPLPHDELDERTIKEKSR